MRRVSRESVLARIEARSSEIEERFSGCAMCAAVADPANARVLTSNTAAVAMLDEYAARPGHIVIVLRRHVEALAELPWEEYSLVQRLAWESARALMRAFAPVRTFVAALGSARRITNSFPHHHVHVLPLWDGGESDRPAEVLTWRHGVYVYDPGEVEEWAGKLRAVWPA